MKIYPTSLYYGYNSPNFSPDGYFIHCMWHSNLLKYGNIKFSELEKSDVILLFIVWGGDKYIFDKVLASKIETLQKPIVIIDYTEYGGWGAEGRLIEYNLYGYNLEYESLTYKDHKLLHEFLLRNQNLIKAYFKRELNHKDTSNVPFKVFPIEYIYDEYTNKSPVQTQEEFLKRPIRCNFTWGHTNISRPILHGKILSKIEKFYFDFDITFASTFRQCEHRLKDHSRLFLLNNVDHYERTDKETFFEYQFRSQIMIDLYGVGIKCFRNIESTNNCISVKQDPSILKYTYPWIDKENCIFLPNRPGTTIINEKLSVEILLHYQHPNNQHLLYPIYLKSLEMNELYSPLNYVPNHIIKNIKKCLNWTTRT